MPSKLSGASPEHCSTRTGSVQLKCISIFSLSEHVLIASQDTQLGMRLTVRTNQGFVHSLVKRYNTMLPMLQVTIRVVFGYLLSKWRSC